MNQSGSRSDDDDNAMVMPLPEGPLAPDCMNEDGDVIYSLGAHAVAEVGLWLTEEPGKVWREWFASHWHGFVRSKMVEHFYGWRQWGCFPEHNFRCLRVHL